MLGLKLNHISKLAIDSKIYATNTVPIWGRQDPGGPHVGSVNFALWEC